MVYAPGKIFLRGVQASGGCSGAGWDAGLEMRITLVAFQERVAEKGAATRNGDGKAEIVSGN
jgi:hypothetical protein